ncbi:cobalamin biosynthesis protein CbiN [Methanoplanus sp. FWC-SCC4]|uniref:Cobalamin biosynthesis protein CbiN n=1 Tax=Methanochimaera problematica TaxID=2609417 RepID=A0AA97FCK5_9EURY|nr:PDGLE domain-containing protein [Methanoplanus sp. FWC-SCC4]WOF15739.1 cobalamin biosynthesis protein CbiN [Methanoplanus sp. FWC-SCC4]
MIDNKTFIAAGIILAIVIGVVAVFMASGDPDGLESTALVVQGEKTLTGLSPEDGDAEAIGEGTFEYEAPLPDYSMEGAGKGGEIFSLIVGIFVTFALIGGVTWAITSKPSKS